jgi:hypothetical protein
VLSLKGKDVLFELLHFHYDGVQLLERNALRLGSSPKNHWFRPCGIPVDSLWIS